MFIDERWTTEGWTAKLFVTVFVPVLLMRGCVRSVSVCVRVPPDIINQSHRRYQQRDWGRADSSALEVACSGE